MAGSRERRRVDWPLVVGPKLRNPMVSSRPAGVVSVLGAADELVSYRDMDTILRRAIELTRDRIGLERVAIFLEDPTGKLLCGTWGTGIAGETTDERHIFFDRGGNHQEAHARSLAGLGRWLVLEDAPLTTQLDNETRVIGYGWIALTPIRSARGALGLMFNDTALSGAPLEEAKQMQAAVFCSLLGNIVDLRRQDAESVPWKPLLATLPSFAHDSPNGLAVAVVQALHDDVTLDGAALARKVAVSAGKLARDFKAEMGVSLVEYRNRLRLERFLSLVDRGGGNLLEAALDAGFGSYAQFHRVFRSMLGTTPREYLTGRR
ncbi:MAG: AraC family transcriptional regulator [Polyangiaceae bacterium]|nr:AraC family transcriptional regulator [Polyangiaceae bacterium]